MNTKLTALINLISNKRRRTAPNCFSVGFPGNWVALRSFWKHQPWTRMNTVNPSYNQVLTWTVPAPDGWDLLTHGMPPLWPSWTALLFPRLCALPQSGQVHSQIENAQRDNVGQDGSQSKPTTTILGEILQNLHAGWPQACLQTAHRDLIPVMRRGTAKSLPVKTTSRFLSWAPGTGVRAALGDSYWAEMPVPRQCHSVIEQDSYTQQLMPRWHWRPPRTRCFYCSSSVRPQWDGGKEEGDIFYLSRLLLPHKHNRNCWRLYMLLKPNSSENTKHSCNTKGRQNKAKGWKKKEQTKERAPILYLMHSKLYSIYIFIMYYPPRRANEKNLVTQREEKKYTPCIVFAMEQATRLYTSLYNLMLCNSIFFLFFRFTKQNIYWEII